MKKEIMRALLIGGSYFVLFVAFFALVAARIFDLPLHLYNDMSELNAVVLQNIKKFDAKI